MSLCTNARVYISVHACVEVSIHLDVRCMCAVSCRWICLSIVDIAPAVASNFPKEKTEDQARVKVAHLLSLRHLSFLLRLASFLRELSFFILRQTGSALMIRRVRSFSLSFFQDLCLYLSIYLARSWDGRRRIISSSLFLSTR